MKIFHLADLHIGLRLLEYDLIPDQRYVFKQIVEAAQDEIPDAIVIAGDIYNKAAPSAESVALYSEFISSLADAAPDVAIMIIAGNHDEALRIDLYGALLKRQNIYVLGTPPRTPDEHIRQVTLKDEYGDVTFWLLPFVSPAKVAGVFDAEERLSYDETLRRLIARENIDDRARNVLVSHQFYVPAGTRPDDIEQMGSENLRVGGLGAIGADVLQPFDYAALGHLHKPMCAGSEYWRYSGTPMQYSVSEAGQAKGIVVVELGKKGDVSTRTIPLHPLHEIRKIEGELEEVLTQASEDYAAIVLDDAALEVSPSEAYDQIRAAFPNLLSFTKTSRLSVESDFSFGEDERDATPLELCMQFLGDITEDEQALLRDVIDEAYGGRK